MYKALKLSLLRLIQDEVNTLSPTIPISVIDWDGHGNINELPGGDLAGLGGLIVTDEGKMWGVTFAVTCATYSDIGSMRLTGLIDHFSRRLKTGAQIDLYDPETAAVVGTMIVEQGTATSPLSRAEVRAAISVTVSASVLPSAAAAALAQ